MPRRLEEHKGRSIMSAGGNLPARLNFGKAPAGYVPGLGRGVSGFAVPTRADLGGTAADPQAAGAPGGFGRGRGRGSALGGRASGSAPGNQGDAAAAQVPFDKFEGNDAGAFASAPAAYDDEDREADAIYEAVDARMLERRRVQREARLKTEVERHRRENPKISDQFRDLKRALGQVSESEWEAIPDIGDYSTKATKKAKVSFVPVPDTLLARAAAEKQATVSSIGADDGRGGASTMTDLTAVGEGRGTVLSLKLDKLGDSVTGNTVVDPKGYLTDLSTLKVNSTADVQDIKKARKLLQSVTQTNPKHAPGWIAAARLESDLGKGSAARTIIAKGCKECPKSEDVWLHAAFLQGSAGDSKIVIARGISACPLSVKLWLEAARLETETADKSRVLRRALERMPSSVRIWRALIDLANEDDARVLLSRAVECCPQHVELWLALAKLETYANAKKILNKARQTLPTEPMIWIAALKLEEANGNGERVNVLMEKAVHRLKRQNLVINRAQWLKYAEECEACEPPAVATCHAIVRATGGEGVDEEDRKATWIADAEECAERGSVETARAIYAHALSVFPSKKGIWRRAAMLEKRLGTPDRLDELLRRAVTYCPQAEMLWLMGAKEKWLSGDVAGARVILQEAFTANPTSEEILLAAFKLEFENNEIVRAKMLLERARQGGGEGGGGGERVWIKSAVLARELGNAQEEREILDGGLKLHPKSWKLWLMLMQAHERSGSMDAARSAYGQAIRRCPNVEELRTSAAAIEERAGYAAKARAILEQSRVKIPGSPNLWLAAVVSTESAKLTYERTTTMPQRPVGCIGGSW